MSILCFVRLESLCNDGAKQETAELSSNISDSKGSLSKLLLGI